MLAAAVSLDWLRKMLLPALSLREDLQPCANIHPTQCLDVACLSGRQQAQLASGPIVHGCMDV